MIKITRNELFVAVWRTPRSRLAKKYGISDVAIAKICRKHKIPMPPRGYWAKPQTKRISINSKLSSPDYNPTIEINPYPHQELSSRNNEILKKAKEKSKIKFTVETDLSKPHHIVGVISKNYRHHTKDFDGFAQSPTMYDRVIRVSPDKLNWALRVMSSLLKALESKGYKISSEIRSGHYENRCTLMEISVIIFEQKITLAIYEKRKVVKTPNDNSYRRQKMTGKLIFKIDGPYTLGRCIAESTPMNFSEKLDDIVLRIEKIAIMKKQQAEEWRKSHLLYRKQERLRKLWRQRKEKLGILKSEENHKFAELLDQSVAFEESKTIREYIKAIEKMWHSKSKELTPLQIGWLKKAHALVDRHDPLSPNPPSILDIKFDDEVFYKPWSEIEKMIRDKLGEYFTP